MGFRFFRRITLLPGVTLNLSKGGGSISLGPRGAKVTVGTSGGRATVGVPGTGLSYTTNFGLGRLLKGAAAKATGTSSSIPQSAAPEASSLDMGFFKRLVTSDDEEALVDGWKALIQNNEDGALAHLRNATHLADGAFLAGCLALKHGQFDEAAKYLEAAVQQEQALGSIFSKHGITATISLAITAEVSVHVGPDIRGVLLALAETYQAQHHQQEALDCLGRLQKLEPNDVVVKLSLAELFAAAEADDRTTAQKLVHLIGAVENETPLHTALLLYKAKALRTLGLLDAASELLSEARKRKKDRSDDLLRALRYEQALVYEGLGQEKRARTELQKIYAEDPAYEDVAKRLGVQ